MLRVFADPTRSVKNFVAQRPARYQDIVRPLNDRLGRPTGSETITRYRLVDSDDESFWTYNCISVEQATVDVPHAQAPSMWTYFSKPQMRLRSTNDS